jgi:hypothetical protein
MADVGSKLTPLWWWTRRRGEDWSPVPIFAKQERMPLIQIDVQRLDLGFKVDV